MYEFNSFFFYKFIFMAEILCSEALFTFRLSRRSFFPLRVILSVVVCFGFAFAYPIAYYNAAYSSLMFIALFGSTLFALKFCYNETWFKIVFLGVSSYSVQHLAYSFYSFINYSFDLSTTTIGVYKESNSDLFTPASFTAYLICYFVVYWLTYLFFARKVRPGSGMIMGRVSMVLSTAIILIDVVLHSVVVYNVPSDSALIVFLIIYIYNMSSCIFALSMQFLISDKVILKSELNTLENLWKQKQKQYELSKENIDLINIKCHDLKHQISSIAGKLDSEELHNIKKAIMIYDSAVKTGNEVLDVIMTEKSLMCESRGIRLNCVIDGEKLYFVSKPDLYSLFGNAIDNAVESVINVKVADKRMIGITVKGLDNLVNIHIENYFHGKISFNNGLPKTTKLNDSYHGFGIKSMKMIAEKYNGRLNIRTEDDKFFLNIILMRPKEN